ncbi:hypothetical protein E8E15_010198 [Penicillium rubens]|nr:hypothetical protein E8E15_010198 [Penicillium rubens]
MTFDEVNVRAVATSFDSLVKFHSSAYGFMVKKTASALECDNLTLSCVAACNGQLYQLEMPALLESPPPWKIHPVISVQHLKPVPSTDPFAESSQSRKLRSTDVSERFSNDTDCHDVATILGTRFRYLGRYKTPKKEYLTHGKVTSYFSCRYTDVGSKDSSQLILLDGTLVSKSQAPVDDKGVYLFEALSTVTKQLGVKLTTIDNSADYVRFWFTDTLRASCVDKKIDWGFGGEVEWAHPLTQRALNFDLR